MAADITTPQEIMQAHDAIDHYMLGPVLDSYVTVTANLGLAPLPDMVEQCVVSDELGLAGTCDNFLSVTRDIEVGGIKLNAGDVVASDKKTTKDSSLRYSWLSFGTQLAIYANGEYIYDPETKQRYEMPDRLRRDVGLVCHLSVMTGKCTYFAIELKPMLEALKLSYEVEDFRRSAKDRVVDLGVGTASLPTAPPAEVMTGPGAETYTSVEAARQQVKESLLACSADRHQIWARWQDEDLGVPDDLTLEDCKHAMALIATLDELQFVADSAPAEPSEAEQLRALIHLVSMCTDSVSSSKFIKALDELDELDDAAITERLAQAWRWVVANQMPQWQPEEIRIAVANLPLDLAEQTATSIEFDGLGTMAGLEVAPPESLILFTEIIQRAQSEVTNRELIINAAIRDVSPDNREQLDQLHGVTLGDESTYTKIETLKCAGVYACYKLGVIDLEGKVSVKQAALLKSFGGARNTQNAGKVAAKMLSQAPPRTGKAVFDRAGALLYLSMGVHSHEVL